jgi:hypothetical protein
MHDYFHRQSGDIDSPWFPLIIKPPMFSHESFRALKEAWVFEIRQQGKKIKRAHFSVK